MTRTILATCVVWLCAQSAMAQVVIMDDFEYAAANADDNGRCDPAFTSGAGGGWHHCSQSDSGDSNPCTLETVTTIPGYSGPMPSGSRALRLHSNAIVAQSDCWLGIGDVNSPENLVPANVWIQFGQYINYDAASGERSDLLSRSWKMLYPCNDADGYPCNSSGYWLMQMGASVTWPNTPGAPQGLPSPGHGYLLLRDNTAGSPHWTGASGGGESHMSQTSLAAHAEPNRWNIIRCNFNTSNASAAEAHCWIAPGLGQPFIKVMQWVHGQNVAGRPFTWTVPVARGHKYIRWPTTHPSGNTWGQEVFVYYDDFTIANRESDLRTYGGTPAPLAPRNIRIGADVLLAAFVLMLLPFRGRKRAS